MSWLDQDLLPPEASRVSPGCAVPMRQSGTPDWSAGWRVARLAAAALMALGLSACFRPLYGPTASGAPLQEVFALTQVEPVTAPPGQERVTHFLRSELV